MTAAFLVLADAAEEGRKVILTMLATGLVFVAVIAIGEAAHYASARRKREKSERPL
jgi:adenine/guanine phosphoribosyltransferase-like PRPP-binding protein